MSTKRSFVCFLFLFAFFFIGGCKRDKEGKRQRAPESQGELAVKLETLGSLEEGRKRYDLESALVTFSKHGRLPTEWRFSDFEEMGTPITTLSLGKGGSIQFNQLGKDFMKEKFLTEYAVWGSDGSLWMVNPQKIVENNTFTLVRKNYISGGKIERVAFYTVTGKKLSNLRRFIPGPTIRDSYIEELLGPQVLPPEEMIGWKREYRGKILSKLYLVDEHTGEAGDLVAWIIDLLRKRVMRGENDYGHCILKKVIPAHHRLPYGLPEYIVCRPPISVFGDQRYIYSGEVINAQGESQAKGPFVSFQCGTLLEGINAPKPNRYTNEPAFP